MPTQSSPCPVLSPVLQTNRLIIASNRGPFECYLDQDMTWKYRRGSGGMITSLVEVSKRLNLTWVSMGMSARTHEMLKVEQNGDELPQLPEMRIKLHSITVPEAVYDKYYEKISNQLFWFLQHYLYDLVDTADITEWIEDAWLNGYCVANQAIADAVSYEVELEQTRAVVMLHDYHLYVVSQILRERYPTLPIQQFIHIPWPDIRYWHVLPRAITRALYQGLMGNDIVGFHTQQDAFNFLEGARSVLDNATIDSNEMTISWRHHCTRVRIYPSSISIIEEQRLAQNFADTLALEQMGVTSEKKLIMRVDRIDPSKNIVRGFQAFACMLEQHPELRRKVMFLAFLVPSRQRQRIYQQYDTAIRNTIHEINQKYSTDQWTPIRAIYGDDRPRALAAMQFYDVLLVNPVIDGMNLIAKEGPVVNQRDGVLVLSYTAGAFQQMGHASLPVAPTDIRGTAHAIYEALSLSPTKKREKMLLARKAVEQYDLNDWLNFQLSDINAVLMPRSHVTHGDLCRY